MSKPVVLVLGSNGYVGKATVKSLSESYADKVAIKAATRDPAKLAELAGLKGVEVVAIDMGAADLANKIKSTGAEAVYVVTPGIETRAEVTVKATTACKDAGIKHLVVVSVLTAELTDTVFGRQFTQIEGHVKKLGVPYTLLRLPFFIDNNWGNVDSIKGQSTGQLFRICALPF
jgi:NAD(P)H dehydrogenase (quinone)